MSPVAIRLTELSAQEIAGALGVARDGRLGGRLGHTLFHAAILAAARVPSARLGKALARFDRRIVEIGIGAAAREILDAFGARLEVVGPRPGAGPLLVTTNHPGAYDALAALAALGRDDVAFLAADRAFLRAMPRLAKHMIFVSEASAAARASGVRGALDWLARGRALVQYGAGAIEPDARFAPRAGDPLGPWHAGTGLIAERAAKMGAAVVPAFVLGVHSPRAKRLSVVRWAERLGTTTIAPLVQATMPGFRDVAVTVRLGTPIDREALLGAPDHAARTSLVRSAVAALA